MKLLLLLVSDSGRVRDYVGRSKEGIVPPEVRQRGFFKSNDVSIRVETWFPEPGQTAASLENFVLQRHADVDAMLIVTERPLSDYVRNIRNAAFVAVVDPNPSTNTHNFLHYVLSRAFKNFGHLLEKFQRTNDHKILLLPLRNFSGVDLANLVEACRNAYDIGGAFNTALDESLSLLRDRIRPKRKSSYATRYVVDDDERYFEYGLERHAQLETGGEHQPHCELCGWFRFGRRIDGRRHYNVSADGRDGIMISGRFVDCHDINRDVHPRTHINMFANDYL
jgi:hypothetical protein